jgi:threonine dehydrogenase-like Zn-dependent dehydrogenase
VKAVIGLHGQVHVTDVPELASPVGSQLLVETLAATICGSDLHVTAHEAAYLAAAADSGSTAMMWDTEKGVLLGHCYSFRVLEAGPEAVGFAPGDVVAGVGTIFKPDGGYHVLGFSDTYPGGYSERMLVSTPGLLAKLPEGLDPVYASFLEPLMVGEMSVRKAQVPDGAPAVVLGTGQVGLGMVTALRRHGCGPIIAAEPSPRRRGLAKEMGADIVVDGRERTWLDALKETGNRQPPTVFDTTGLVGMLGRLFLEVPAHSHIVEVSGQFEPDTIPTGLAVGKNLRITFTADFDPAALGPVLQAIADGDIDVSGWITDQVTLDDVPAAFERLRHPDDTVAIVVRPGGVG